MSIVRMITTTTITIIMITITTAIIFATFLVVYHCYYHSRASKLVMKEEQIQDP